MTIFQTSDGAALPNVLFLSLLSLTVDNKIIYIDFTAFNVSHNIIDHSLKGCRCIFIPNNITRY